MEREVIIYITSILLIIVLIAMLLRTYFKLQISEVKLENINAQLKDTTIRLENTDAAL